MRARTPILVFACIVGAIAVARAFDEPLLGIVPAAAVLVAVLLRFPEVSFVLFLNAGIFKADPRLAQFGSGFLDVTVLLQVVCAIGIIIALLSHRLSLKKPPTSLMGAATTLLVLTFIGYAYTPAPIYGWEKLLRFAIITMFALFTPWFLCQEWKNLRRILFTWLLIGIAMILDLVSGGVQPGGFNQVFGSSGYLGLALVCAQGVLVVSFAIIPTTRTVIAAVGAAGLGAAFLFGGLLSGARTANVVLGAVLMITMVGVGIGVWRPTSRQSQERRSYTRLLGALALTAVPFFWFAGPYFAYFQERLQNLFAATSFYAAERLSLIPSALGAMSSNPWGLGIGGFSMYHYNLDGPRGGFPHNILLEVGSELGFIGLIAFSILCGAALKGAAKSLRHVSDSQYWYGVTVLALWLFEFIYFQFHGDINDARTLFAWTGVLFAYAHIARRAGPANV